SKTSLWGCLTRSSTIARRENDVSLTPRCRSFWVLMTSGSGPVNGLGRTQNARVTVVGHHLTAIEEEGMRTLTRTAWLWLALAPPRCLGWEHIDAHLVFDGVPRREWRPETSQLHGHGERHLADPHADHCRRIAQRERDHRHRPAA